MNFVDLKSVSRSTFRLTECPVVRTSILNSNILRRDKRRKNHSSVTACLFFHQILVHLASLNRSYMETTLRENAKVPQFSFIIRNYFLSLKAFSKWGLFLGLLRRGRRIKNERKYSVYHFIGLELSLSYIYMWSIWWGRVYSPPILQEKMQNSFSQYFRQSIHMTSQEKSFDEIFPG